MSAVASVDAALGDGIVVNGESGEFLFELVPGVGVVRVVSRGNSYLIDLVQLIALHKNGARRACAHPLSQVKRDKSI